MNSIFLKFSMTNIFSFENGHYSRFIYVHTQLYYLPKICISIIDKSHRYVSLFAELNVLGALISQTLVFHQIK